MRAEPAGEWAIVTSGTKAYSIKPKRARVLAARGNVIGVRARRPRTRGTDYWTPATRRLEHELATVVADVMDAEMNAAAR